MKDTFLLYSMAEVESDFESASNNQKQTSVELIKFEENNEIHYQGYCKLGINIYAKCLTVVPVLENFKDIIGFTAPFKWKFIRQKSKDYVHRKLLHKQFIIPFFKNIAQNDLSRLKEIMQEWIEKHEENEKEYYLTLLNRYISPQNVYRPDVLQQSTNVTNQQQQQHLAPTATIPGGIPLKTKHRESRNPQATTNVTTNQQQPAAQSNIPLFGTGNMSSRLNPLAEFLNNNARVSEYTNSDAAVAIDKNEIVPKGLHSKLQQQSPQNVQDSTDPTAAVKRPFSVLPDFDPILQPSAPKASRVDEPESMHQIFFDDTYDARQKLVKMFNKMEFGVEIGEYQIPLPQLRLAQLCRQVDNKQINYFVLRMKQEGRANVQSILTRTFVVAYRILEPGPNNTRLFGIVEGNCRLASIHQFNHANADNPITSMAVHYILSRKPTRSEAIIISSLASQHGQRDRLQYTKAEILRNSRLLLKHQPNIIAAQAVEDQNLDPKEWKKKYESKVKDELTKILQVDPSKVLAPIWRTVFISDDHFADMETALVSHGTSIKKCQLICNMYRKRPGAVFELCTARDIAVDDSNTFFERLRNIRGADFSYLLKEKKAYDYQRSDEYNMGQIMGEYIHDIEEEHRSIYMEKFLKSDKLKGVSRHRNYPTVDAKQIYLKTKFGEWFDENPHVMAESTEDDKDQGKNGKNEYDCAETSESEDGAEESAAEDAAATAAVEGGNRQPRINRPRKGPQNEYKRPSKTLKLKNTNVSTIQQNYLGPLIGYPHIQALISYTLKSFSTNFDNLAAQNPLSKALEGYETNEGSFDWEAFERRQNQDDS